MQEELLGLIATNADVLHGQAHIRGTRVPVALILDCLAGDMTHQEILDEYPTLPPGSVRAALAYAATLAREEVHPIPPTSQSA